MSIHASLLDPFECSGPRFFFCKYKRQRVFPPKQQNFALGGGGGGLPKEETRIRSAKVITAATNLVAILRLLNFSH